jgi:hypothetical protein
MNVISFYVKISFWFFCSLHIIVIQISEIICTFSESVDVEDKDIYVLIAERILNTMHLLFIVYKIDLPLTPITFRKFITHNHNYFPTFFHIIVDIFCLRSSNIEIPMADAKFKNEFVYKLSD